MSGNGEVWYRAAVAGTFRVSLINLIQLQILCNVAGQGLFFFTANL